jgi:YfiH family protein
MLREEQNGLKLLRFAGLATEPGLSHAVTTRQGGVSQGPYAGLNLGFRAGGEGDDPTAVRENLRRVRETLGLKRLVFARQVHGTEIVAVEGLAGTEGEAMAEAIAEADGLATDQPGVGLLIKQADCQAVILYAPERRVVANLHVGWRGNVANMPAKGVAFLQERYGVDPAEIKAGVSPSLGPCCAEFVNHASELGPAYLAYQVRPEHFDLWQVSVDQLCAAGVALANIEVSGLCTRCAAMFYSYRREGVTGRFGTVAALV